MRLNEVRKIISENIEHFYFKHTVNNNNTYTLSDTVSTIDAIENLSQLPFLLPSIEKVRACSNIYTSRMKAINVSAGEFNIFNDAVKDLHSQCEIILSLAKDSAPSMSDQNICVNVHKTSNLSDVRKLIENLDDAFSKITNLTNYKGSVRFAGFESGSDWINLLVDGAKLLPLVYILIDASYKVVNDYYNIKLIQQRYRGAIIQNEVNENLKSTIKDMTSVIIAKLHDDKKVNIEPEEIERLVLCTTSLSSMIIDGNKVLPSLTAPQEHQSKLKESSAQLESQLKELKLLEAPSSEPESSPTPDEPIA